MEYITSKFYFNFFLSNGSFYLSFYENHLFITITLASSFSNLLHFFLSKSFFSIRFVETFIFYWIIVFQDICTYCRKVADCRYTAFKLQDAVYHMFLFMFLCVSLSVSVHSCSSVSHASLWLKIRADNSGNSTDTR